MEAILKVLELVAASWYVAYVLTNKGGPFNAFARVREWRGGRWHGRFIDFKLIKNEPQYAPVYEEQTMPGLMDCIVCMLPYVALGWWLIDQAGAGVVLLPFAISGLALWAHSYTGWIHFGGK
jgi:hypothetical protein